MIRKKEYLKPLDQKRTTNDFASNRAQFLLFWSAQGTVIIIERYNNFVFKTYDKSVKLLMSWILLKHKFSIISEFDIIEPCVTQSCF